MALGPESRVVTWFSSGAASAVAAKIMHDLSLIHGFTHKVVRIHIDNEHEDNSRFADECASTWGFHINTITSDEYKDCWDVWTRRRYIVGPDGAPCTLEMKKAPRWAFEKEWLPSHQAFGFTSEEKKRAERFVAQNPDVRLLVPLIDEGVDKNTCMQVLREFGIDIPIMYRLGYRNNNCIGCVKGGMGYWNKIRVDFPDIFNRMALLERDIGATICKLSGPGRPRIYLDELPPELGRYDPLPDIECSLVCVSADT